jgi:multicomponent K+:H+ antiporter subunit D
LSGFVAKLALLMAMINLDGLGTTAPIAAPTWLLSALVILSGLAALVAMMRTGIRTFWAPLEAIIPRVLVVEVAPIVMLLVLCLALTIRGRTVIEYTDATARSLHNPGTYIQSVLGTNPSEGDAK